MWFHTMRGNVSLYTSRGHHFQDFHYHAGAGASSTPGSWIAAGIDLAPDLQVFLSLGSTVMNFNLLHRERSGRVLDLRPQVRASPASCVVSLSKNSNPSLVLVQPRKTRPFITERLLMGQKELNQTNKNRKIIFLYLN